MVSVQIGDLLTGAAAVLTAWGSTAGIKKVRRSRAAANTASAGHSQAETIEHLVDTVNKLLAAQKQDRAELDELKRRLTAAEERAAAAAQAEATAQAEVAKWRSRAEDAERRLVELQNQAVAGGTGTATT